MSGIDEIELANKAKQWFGDGEYDVDLMIACGIIPLDEIIEMYKREVLNEQD